MTAHSLSKEEVLKGLASDENNGLSSHEARLRLEKYGANELKTKKSKTFIQRFFDQFKDMMIIILIAAAVVSFIIAVYERNTSELIEPALIMLIVILNALMGVIQESKAEKALDALKNLSSPHAKVLRDGRFISINAKELVIGDIIKLEAGDFIPADARLLTSSSLKSEESALTGESVPSEKDFNAVISENAPIGDRSNMVYTGCSITNGRATAVVTKTGMDTEMGKIANLLDNEKETLTPLQTKLFQLGKYLGLIALVACGVIFIFGLLYKIPIMEIFMTAVSLAVSAIPEGLPAIVTIVLSIGVQRMVKRNAIIRRLPAVETLGSASVICSDKTGTLTQNRMTLTKAFDAQSGIFEDIDNNNSAEIKKILKYATLCCDGYVTFEGNKEKHIGDPTETSIVLAAHKNGMHKDELEKEFPRVAEIPFDSVRKLMTTVHKTENGYKVIVKGAFDVLSTKCISGNIDEGKRLTEEMSKMALRILAVGVKEIYEVPQNPTPEELENSLTFVGLVGMIDPPRPEAKEAVLLCRKAGIKPVMITGDHVATASAIAKEIGILLEGGRAITGAELNDMTEDELNSSVQNISVYARVSPEDKIRIVKAWQNRGEIVSMTGDGVNDAPALKAADIGCAMGITGTDVAKSASDMILTDDNFATIVQAVKEGRGIYENIKKVIAFLLGTNIGELLTVFFAMLFFKLSPLLSMQLLWINLVTDSLPAIALGMEAVKDDIMLKNPKPKDEGIFAHGLGIKVCLQGILFAILTLIGFQFGKTIDIESGRTMAFIVLAMSQVVHSFNNRSNHSIFKIGIFTNKYLNGAALISTTLVALVLFIPPISLAFELKRLPVHMYYIALGLAFVPLLVLEISKALGLIKQR